MQYNITSKVKKKYNLLKQTLKALKKKKNKLKKYKVYKNISYKLIKYKTPRLNVKDSKKVFFNKDSNWSFQNDLTDDWLAHEYIDYLNKRNKINKKPNIYRFNKRTNIRWYKIYNKRFLIDKRKHNKKLFAFKKIKHKNRLLYIFLPKIKELMKTNLKFFKKYKYINIIGKAKNLFINYSSFDGKVIKNFSSGFYFKGSLKRSFYAMESLLLKSNFGFKSKNDKLIINVISSFKDFKIKKNLKKFFKENRKLKIMNLNYIRIRAHNGVRARKQRRK